MTQKSERNALRFGPLEPQHIEDMAALEQVCFSVPWSRETLESELDKGTVITMTF